MKEFTMKTVCVLFDEMACTRNVTGLRYRRWVVFIQQTEQFFAVHS